ANMADLWRDIFVRPYGFMEVDTPCLLPAPILEASGHVSNFKDPMAECASCSRKYRADHLIGEAGGKVSEAASPDEMLASMEGLKVRCPECGGSSWTVRPFLTMFETGIGPYAEGKGYLRPETAQGIFVEFNRLLEIERERVPLGIAQVGRGFRNEISPRQGMVRLRELHMMELEMFVDPEDATCPYMEDVRGTRLLLLDGARLAEGSEEPREASVEDALSQGMIKTEWLAFFMALSQRFLTELGIPPERQRFREKLSGERAHYSAQTFDHEVLMDGMGWLEVAGHAYRTDYDVASHMKKTGADYLASVRLARPTRERRRIWSINVGALKAAQPERWKEVLKEYGGIKDRTGEPPVSLAGVRVEPSFLVTKEDEVVVETRKFVPHVVEPSFGLERLMLACMVHAYSRQEDRTVLKLPYRLAPVKVGVFPLVNRAEMEKTAKELLPAARKEGAVYDESGSIGRRYARIDEIGVPLGITVDGQTLQDGTVTVRDRDTWRQERVNAAEIPSEIRKRLTAS
ncbi:MAG: glycine--tRNA ligase, partial [Nitrososphaerota archaeon]|nr:glycine--tRNA ligase [Nitrososphaerota archaeon]